MRIIYFGNNWLGWQVAKWLKGQNEEIVGLVVHPRHKRTYGDEIISSCGVNPDHIIDGSQITSPDVRQVFENLGPDIGLSVLFDYILGSELLDVFPRGVVNLHPSYLPYNRGQYPNVWSIIDGTPAGASLHYVDRTVDTGDIVFRREVPVEPIDTGETLYRKLEQSCLELFKESWPTVRTGMAPRTPQHRNEGTYHVKRDVERVDCIEPNGTYTGRELINIIRARTFPPYRGAYFIHEGEKIYLELKLYREGTSGGKIGNG